VRSSEITGKIKEVNQLDLQVFKTKGYVLTMIERLELMEGKLDQIMDFHVKRKLAAMESKVVK
jgi:gamma-glutamyl phosphate reductase